jgi:hypothetical protein
VKFLFIGLLVVLLEERFYGKDVLVRLKLFWIFVISVTSSVTFAMTNGLSVDLKNGIGYTMFLDRVWGGISLNASQHRFGDNQMVVSPRIYGNYDICGREGGSLFGGVSYSDDFGLRNDSIVNKNRLLAFTLGISAKVTEKFKIASWVNAVGIRDDLIYDPTTGRRYFDTNANRRSIMDFGGLLVTYLF